MTHPITQPIDSPTRPDASPNASGIRVSLSEATTRTVTIVVDGRLDALSAMPFREDLDRVLDEGVGVLRIDLTSIEFVDSAGLAALVSALKRCRRQGGEMELVRPRSDDAFRVFKLTKFDAVFTILPPSLPPTVD